jgi:hypothetical protein
MTASASSSAARRRATVGARFGLTMAVALAGAGCAAAGTSPTPTAVPTSVVGSPAVSSVAPSAPSAPTPASPSAGTTQTDWGEIRDALPAAFPLPPGAEPSDLPDGPYSGAFTTTTPAAGVATAVEAGLRDAGWTGVTVSGPTEAGEVTIDATGATAGCRARVSVRPLGGLAAIVVLYGAACP